jgi:hypothetical protein
MKVQFWMKIIKKRYIGIFLIENLIFFNAIIRIKINYEIINTNKIGSFYNI